MRLARLLPVLCVSFLVALPARADIAGQVLSMVGEALALRAGHIVPLFPGAGIESGDQIHTGPDSNVQIRFTDWGFISLRARTDFVVEDYVYEARQGGREQAFFSLLNGGVRSLTGLIGRRDHAHYRLRAPTATIGIRGTHFSLLICKHDCTEPDGSLGADGLYGGVLEGRIAVSPYGGGALEREFGAGEFFHLVDEKSVPAPLFSPPPFFQDRLDPQARAGGATDSPISTIGKVVPGVNPAPANPVAGVTGGLTGALVSTLPTAAQQTVSPLVRRVAGTTGGLTGALSTTLPAAATQTISPLVKQVVTPAEGLAGSAVNWVFSMPALGPVIPQMVNAVPVLATPPGLPSIPAPVLPVTVPVAPITTPIAPITTPIAPITTPIAPITTPVAPITTPVAPITTPVAPITTPVAPITTPVIPITTPTVPPVTTPVGALFAPLLQRR